MEIEAKFAVKSDTIFARIAHQTHLLHYVITTPHQKIIRDFYLDTPTWEILQAGYVLRRREKQNDPTAPLTMTLKGLGGVQQGIHRREELETALPINFTAAQWQADTVYQRLKALVGPINPKPRFHLEQIRTVYPLTHQGNRIAEMSLDQVTLVNGERRGNFLELEVELFDTGTEADLAVISKHFTEMWGLQPEQRSKFERGLAFSRT